MYEFALNAIKLQRAIGFCNGNPDAGCVFAVYKKLGGAVKPDYVEPVVEAPVVEEVTTVTEKQVTMPVVEEEPVVKAPKKKKAKK